MTLLLLMGGAGVASLLAGTAAGTSTATATGLRQTQPLAATATGTSSASGNLSTGAAALAVPAFGARPQKTVLYALYDSLAGVGGFTGTANLMGWWYDVTSKLSFGVTTSGGTSDLQVTLPRRYGAMGEQYESSGMDVTVKHGYRLDVWVADRDTLRGVDPSTWGRLVYRGTVEYYESDLHNVTITVAHIGRIAKTAPIKGDYAIGGGAAGAKALIDAYLTGLVWDTNNSVSSSHTSGNPQPSSAKSIYVADALNAIVASAGVRWVWFVTPTGTVRFFQQSISGTAATGSTRHVLTVGGEVSEKTIKLGKDQRDRRWEISLWWNNAGVMTEANVQGASYDARDPRTYIIQKQDIIDATDAANAAQGLLTELDRIKLTAQVVVSDASYDIEAISVGDVVRLVVPRQVGTNSFAGYQDFNDVDLVVMGLRYDFDSVTLDLDGLFPATMVQSGTSPLSHMAEVVRALAARVA